MRTAFRCTDLIEIKVWEFMTVEKETIQTFLQKNLQNIKNVEDQGVQVRKRYYLEKDHNEGHDY